MLAIILLGLLFTAVTISLRSKWQAEQSRRVAQEIVVTWMKAHSKAWRDGVEWVVTVDETNSVVSACPVPSESADSSSSQENASLISLKLDRNIRVVPEDRDEMKPVHFFPDGRATQMSVLVVGPDGNVWKVKTDWTGQPSMEHAVAPAK